MGNAFEIVSFILVQAKLGTRGFCFGQHSKEKEAKRKVSLRNKFLRLVLSFDLKVSLRVTYSFTIVQS